jgi:hypothetical protein
MPVVDLEATSLRSLNQLLHGPEEGTNETYFRIANPRGRHAVAVGLDAPVTVEIDGNVGYYCAGMNAHATVIVNGSAGVGVAENMMSGRVHVKGDAGASAGASGCGGLLVIDGNASGRCFISARGIEIVVKGSVGHMSAFMAQAGTLVVLGDAGQAGVGGGGGPAQTLLYRLKAGPNSFDRDEVANDGAIHEGPLRRVPGDGSGGRLPRPFLPADEGGNMKPLRGCGEGRGGRGGPGWVQQAHRYSHLGASGTGSAVATSGD